MNARDRIKIFHFSFISVYPSVKSVAQLWNSYQSALKSQLFSELLDMDIYSSALTFKLITPNSRKKSLAGYCYIRIMQKEYQDVEFLGSKRYILFSLGYDMP